VVGTAVAGSPGFESPDVGSLDRWRGDLRFILQCLMANARIVHQTKPLKTKVNLKCV
jgi:hypothetical protein